MASFILANDQQVAMAVRFVDAAGNTVPPKGGATWSVADDTVLQLLNPSADGLSATIVTVGPVGTSQVAVKENDPGTDSVAVTGILEVQVVASEAVSAVITPGTPEPKAASQSAPAGRRRG